jgi:hypothetical protein
MFGYIEVGATPPHDATKVPKQSKDSVPTQEPHERHRTQQRSECASHLLNAIKKNNRQSDDATLIIRFEIPIGTMICSPYPKPT